MFVRRAVTKDIPEIARLLYQVNNVHADIRPDLFVHDLRKYTDEEIAVIIKDDETPVFVCFEDVNSDKLLGYCFAVFERKHGHSVTPVKTLYLDDICVDEKERGRHVATEIFEHVKEFAVKSGCYDITLNVWEGNDGAKAFYEAMGFKVLKYGMEIVL
ncbi:MAG: GNAT family N-acetyltransferase [Clostridiales bacterium]|nr:GNAT family N-acetyltransferase [Clostridiales bacterium]